MFDQINGWHISDGILKCVFLIKYYCIFIKISLKFVPKNLIDHTSELVQAHADNKSSAEPMLQFTEVLLSLDGLNTMMLP